MNKDEIQLPTKAIQWAPQNMLQLAQAITSFGPIDTMSLKAIVNKGTFVKGKGAIIYKWREVNAVFSRGDYR